MKTDTVDIMRIASNEMELVDFRIYEEKDGELYEGVYGINVSKVSSVVSYPNEIFESPGSPDYMLGMFDLRGEILPLIDLAKWLNITPREDAVREKKVIVTDFNNKQLGFAVHSTRRLRRISWADIESAMFDLSSEEQRGKITGTTRIEDGRTLLILDLEGIVDDLALHSGNGNVNEEIEQYQPSHRFDGSVLILDDSTIARRLLSNALSKVGFDVIDAIDGESGLQRLEQLYERWGNDITKHLKLIVSDVEMPKMDGFHFAAKVKNDARFSKIPLVFNSSISDKFSASKGKQIGADAYLVKFDTKVFYDEITRILSK